MISNGIEWNKCVGICTHGACAMTGHKSRVITKIQCVAPLALTVHCSIHMEALVTKTCPEGLSMVLKEVIKIVNFKVRPSNSRLFAVLCAEMGLDHQTLQTHIEIWWLSKG